MFSIEVGHREMFLQDLGLQKQQLPYCLCIQKVHAGAMQLTPVVGAGMGQQQGLLLLSLPLSPLSASSASGLGMCLVL